MPLFIRRRTELIWDEMWERRRGSLLEVSDQKGLQPSGRINDFNGLERKRVGCQVGSLR
jgi:hypothetical protein